MKLAFSIPPPLVNPLLTGTNLLGTQRLITSLKESTLKPVITRKLMHIISAPAFMVTWPFYNDNNPELWATFIPLLMTLLTLNNFQNVNNIISRSGKKNELLGGPFLYSLWLSYFTYDYWNNNNYIGILSMVQLAFGDGFADLLGRNIKYKHYWWYNKNKSIEGTLAFIITSFLGSGIFNHYFEMSKTPEELIVISLACALVETLPFIDDNISIPLIVILFN